MSSPSDVLSGSTLDVVAERRFDVSGRYKNGAVVRIGLPRRQGNIWTCPCEFVGLTEAGSVRVEVPGVDSIQALRLSLDMVRAMAEAADLQFRGYTGAGFRVGTTEVLIGAAMGLGGFAQGAVQELLDRIRTR